MIPPIILRAGPRTLELPLLLSPQGSVSGALLPLGATPSSSAQGHIIKQYHPIRLGPPLCGSSHTGLLETWPVF